MEKTSRKNQVFQNFRVQNLAQNWPHPHALGLIPKLFRSCSEVAPKLFRSFLKMRPEVVIVVCADFCDAAAGADLMSPKCITAACSNFGDESEDRISKLFSSETCWHFACWLLKKREIF